MSELGSTTLSNWSCWSRSPNRSPRLDDLLWFADNDSASFGTHIFLVRMCAGGISRFTITFPLVRYSCHSTRCANSLTPSLWEGTRTSQCKKNMSYRGKNMHWIRPSCRPGTRAGHQPQYLKAKSSTSKLTRSTSSTPFHDTTQWRRKLLTPLVRGPFSC